MWQAWDRRQDRQCTHKRTLQRVRVINCCRGKAKRITYSECVSVALVIQHAKRMSLIVTCDLSSSAVFFHIIL